MNHVAHVNLKASQATADHYVMEDMKAAISRHLTAALLECSSIARDLSLIDADQLMVDLRAEFDPHNESSRLQDCFDDAFFAHENTVKDAGGEPITNHGKLPSGVHKMAAE